MTSKNLFDHDPAEGSSSAAEAPEPKLHNIPQGLPEDWLRELQAEFSAEYFQELRQFVSQERKQYRILPEAADVFNAFRYTPLNSCRVVILGQDPYPTPGHAHGLCFSVRPGVSLPGSLRNIYKELSDDLGIAPASHGYLESWARQGVFLLNTVLTVRAGAPASHAGKGWEKFTDAVLRIINDCREKVIFVLWGKHAQAKLSLIDPQKHTVLKSAHPSPMSAAAGFFGTKPFSRINRLLEQSGLPGINWALPALD